MSDERERQGDPERVGRDSKLDSLEAAGAPGVATEGGSPVPAKRATPPPYPSERARARRTSTQPETPVALTSQAPPAAEDESFIPKAPPAASLPREYRGHFAGVEAPSGPGLRANSPGNPQASIAKSGAATADRAATSSEPRSPASPSEPEYSVTFDEDIQIPIDTDEPPPPEPTAAAPGASAAAAKTPVVGSGTTSAAPQTSGSPGSAELRAGAARPSGTPGTSQPSPAIQVMRIIAVGVSKPADEPIPVDADDIVVAAAPGPNAVRVSAAPPGAPSAPRSSPTASAAPVAVPWSSAAAAPAPAAAPVTAPAPVPVAVPVSSPVAAPVPVPVPVAVPVSSPVAAPVPVPVPAAVPVSSPVAAPVPVPVPVAVPVSSPVAAPAPGSAGAETVETKPSPDPSESEGLPEFDVVVAPAATRDSDEPEELTDDDVAPDSMPSTAVKVSHQPPAKADAKPPPPPPRRSSASANAEPERATAPAEERGEAPRAEDAKKSRRAWWELLFSEDFARANARLRDEQVVREVNFIEESLGVAPSGVVLDLGCGAGQHAVELASRGYGVVGYDLSLFQLALAAENAQERGQKLNLLQGDMREMAFDEMFDGIFSWNTSFGYFEEEKNLHVAQRIFRALRPGGMFLIDVANRDFVSVHQPSSVWYEGDACVCMDDVQMDFITSRLRVKRSLILDDGRTRECVYSIRVYALHELGKLLHEVGFKITEASGHPATPGVFLGQDSPRIIMLAQRP